MSILFSPIGTADPLTQLGDGPMLHIVRHYKPNKVVLFLSSRMREFQNLDERYTDAIERLCASDGRPMPCVLLVDSAHDNVFRFDDYIDEFEGILKGLCDESADEPVLVNVTSGTPGWQQALVALGSFGRLNLKLLQVTTPRKDINKRQDRERPTEYDPAGMWELNELLREEEPESRESRIIEVTTPNFTERLQRENVATLVRNFEYEAAYELAYEVKSISNDAKRAIEAARDRLNLDGSKAARAFGGTALSYNPSDLLGEYLSVMEVRLKQGHWADFVLLLSPAFTQLCIEELRYDGLPEHAYLKTDRGKPTMVPNWDAIYQDDRLRRVFKPEKFGESGFIKNVQLSLLVAEYCADEPTRDIFRRLRHMEDKCRNALAHEVRSSKRETLERAGGLSLDTAMKYLFELYDKLHGKARRGLYADISRSIIDLL